MSSRFPIQVRLPSKSQLKITVSPRSSVALIKAEINRLEGVVPPAQSLTLPDGKKLEDSKQTIGDLGIKENDEIVLSILYDMASEPKSVDDIRAWSPSAVYKWAKRIGVPEEQAIELEKQGVDGRLFLAIDETIMQNDLKMTSLNSRRIQLNLRVARSEGAILGAAGRFNSFIPRKPLTNLSTAKNGVDTFVLPPSFLPKNAYEIMLFVRVVVKKQAEDKQHEVGEFQVFTIEGNHTFAKYVSILTGSNSGDVFVSENITLPLTTNRQLHVAYIGPTGLENVEGEVCIAGYR